MSDTSNIYVCEGCGQTTAMHPERQLQYLRDHGYQSCCPDRNMLPKYELPRKLVDQLIYTKSLGHKELTEAGLTDPWCWQWTGRQNRNGYGRVWWEGAEPVTHRLIYQMVNGPVPKKILLDHRCRNRLCSNPAHLEPVTTKVNTERGQAVLFKKAEDYDKQELR